MNEIQIFKNPQFGAIRTVEKNGEPWFVGKDVAESLGYAKSRNALAVHVDAEDKKDALIRGTLGGTQAMTVINESGLYSLILSSKLPSAKAFKHWVTHEVIPSIRKTGGYIEGQEHMSDADLMAKALLIAQRQIEQRQQQIDMLQAENARLLPDAEYGRDLQASNGITTTSIAKEFCMSARALNGLLHGLGIQYKQSGQWLLYSRYHGKGLTTTRTIPITRSDGRKDVKRETVWTMKGHRFICDKLAEQGIFPNEQSTES